MENSSKRKRLRAPSPAMIVACIALAIALSGVGYAAITIPNNSVGTAQLKNNAVSNAKLQGNSVGSGKLQEQCRQQRQGRDGSLTGDDIDQGVPRRGGRRHARRTEPRRLPPGSGDRLRLVRCLRLLVGGSGRRSRPAVSLHTPTTGTRPRFARPPAPRPALRPPRTRTSISRAAPKITTMFLNYVDDAGTTTANGTVTLVRQPIFTGRREQHESDDLLCHAVGRRSGRLAEHGGRHADASGGSGSGDRRQRELRLHAHGEPRTNAGVAYCSVKITYELP